jgi:hypothetical protein
LFGTAGVDLAPVITCALIRIGKQTIGSRNFFEALFSLPVPGVEIGMELLGQAAISLLDVIRRGSAFNASVS